MIFFLRFCLCYCVLCLCVVGCFGLLCVWCRVMLSVVYGKFVNKFCVRIVNFIVLLVLLVL